VCRLQTKTSNHAALNIHPTLTPFYLCTTGNTRGKNQEIIECRIVENRSPTLSERGLPEEFAVIHAETSGGIEAMFNIPHRQ